MNKVNILYDYITSSLTSEEVVNITRQLLNYTKGKKEKAKWGSLLDLALFDEIKLNLENRDEIINFNDRFVEKITQAIINRYDEFWENFDNIITYELDLESEGD